MGGRARICITLVGDITRDSRSSRFADTLASRYDVDVVALGPADADFLHGRAHVSQRAHAHPRSLRASLWNFWREGAERALATRADLYIASDLYALPVASAAAARSGAALFYDSRELYPSVAALRGKPLTRAYWRYIERRHTRRASCISTVNESIASLLRRRYPSLRVETLANMPHAWAGGKSTLLRDALSVSDEQLLLLSQGGLQQGRGAELYVDILPALPRCTLVFLGDGPLKDPLRLRAEARGVADRVAFLPAVPAGDLLAWTSSADIGLCMIENLGRSYYYSLPNKLFEYIMAGLPVVGSSFPEIQRVVLDAGVGVVADPAKRDDVVRAVAALCDDPARRNACAEAALHARGRYSWETQSAALLAIVAELLEKKKSRQSE